MKLSPLLQLLQIPSERMAKGQSMTFVQRRRPYASGGPQRLHSHCSVGVSSGFQSSPACTIAPGLAHGHPHEASLFLFRVGSLSLGTGASLSSKSFGEFDVCSSRAHDPMVHASRMLRRFAISRRLPPCMKPVLATDNGKRRSW